MKYAWFTIAVLGAASAVQAGPLPFGPPPEAYRDPVDQELARTGKGVPCSYEEMINGVKGIVSKPTAVCYKMLPQQRWRGLWVSRHEYSIFCPEPARTCNSRTSGVARLEDGPGRTGYGSIYRVDFVGRRTIYPGNYDGLGKINHIILMDRAISIELIKPSPITHIKRCGTASPARRAQERWCFEGEGQK